MSLRRRRPDAAPLKGRRGRPPRRFPGWLAAIVVVAGVVLVAGVPYLIASDDARNPGYPVREVSLSLPPGVELAQLQRVRVVQVVDGDTIDVILNERVVRLRYYGVDTPERGDRCFREAAERNNLLVKGHVLLLPDSRDTDPFGRTLRYVFLDNGVSVDATLVAEGYGLAWRADGRYREEIAGLEASARAAGEGCLWRGQ